MAFILSIFSLVAIVWAAHAIEVLETRYYNGSGCAEGAQYGFSIFSPTNKCVNDTGPGSFKVHCGSLEFFEADACQGEVTTMDFHSECGPGYKNISVAMAVCNDYQDGTIGRAYFGRSDECEDGNLDRPLALSDWYFVFNTCQITPGVPEPPGADADYVMPPPGSHLFVLNDDGGITSTFWPNSSDCAGDFFRNYTFPVDKCLQKPTSFANFTYADDGDEGFAGTMTIEVFVFANSSAPTSKPSLSPTSKPSLSPTSKPIPSPSSAVEISNVGLLTACAALFVAANNIMA